MKHPALCAAPNQAGQNEGRGVSKNGGAQNEHDMGVLGTAAAPVSAARPAGDGASSGAFSAAIVGGGGSRSSPQNASSPCMPVSEMRGRVVDLFTKAIMSSCLQALPPFCL